MVHAEGMYMMEVDRVLRPGGYWILSGPPVNWRENYQSWKRPKEELEEDLRRIKSLAKLLCWEKKYEKGNIIIWQKTASSTECNRRKDNSISMCASPVSDNIWYLL
jgi:Putative S-adenosyl-L-methionine-dependent methyltransferase